MYVCFTANVYIFIELVFFKHFSKNVFLDLGDIKSLIMLYFRVTLTQLVSLGVRFNKWNNHRRPHNILWKKNII